MLCGKHEEAKNKTSKFISTLNAEIVFAQNTSLMPILNNNKHSMIDVGFSVTLERTVDVYLVFYLIFKNSWGFIADKQ